MRRDEIELPPPSGVDRPGSNWMCGRCTSNNPGDGTDSICSFGPDQRGRCPLTPPCQPRRTWTARKRQVVWLSSLLAIACAALIIWMPAWMTPSRRLIKPGELTSAHAQILESTLETQRCAACHPNAGETSLGTITRVVSTAFSADAHGVTQSQLCLDCHQTTMPRTTAMFAHNLPIESRDAIRLASSRSTETAGDRSWHDFLPSPSVNQDDIQCSTCHREHHGSEHDLKHLTDAQCQTCHQDRFGDFASSHPEFGDWPYGRGGTVAFDHRSHLVKHYPASTPAESFGPMAFDCRQCHTIDSSGQVARTVGYETACASCHDETLKLETADGLELFALPTIPASATTDVNHWPEQATGFFDGNLSPLTRLLVGPIEGLPNGLPDDGFARMNPDSAADLQIARAVAKSLRDLMEKISTQGQSAIIERMIQRGIERSTAEKLAQSFSPQLVDGAIERWFRESVDFAKRRKQRSVFRSVQFQTGPNDDLLNDDLLGGDDLLGDDDLLSGDDLLDGDLLGDDDDLLGGDDLLDEDLLGGVDPLAITETPRSKSPIRFDADRMLESGGWYRDDIRLAIRYRGNGHADPALTAVIEAAAQLPRDDRFSSHMLNHKSVKACLQCHSAAATTAGMWKSEPLVGRRDSFTKFSHAPHLNIASLADCQSCHQVQTAPTAAEVLAGTQLNEFAAIKQQDCAACHHQDAAGDSCVDCHRYHITP